MTTCFENALPVEMWQKILGKVSPGDLCNVMLTSRHMNNVASSPDLWSGMKVNIKKLLDCNGLIEFYEINRFKKVKEIHFVRMLFTTEQLQKVLESIPGTHLESVNFRNLDLTVFSGDLLSRVVCNLKSVNLSGTNLTFKQLQRILQDIPGTSLESVNFRGLDLTSFSAKLLARAVCHLKVSSVLKYSSPALNPPLCLRWTCQISICLLFQPSYCPRQSAGSKRSTWRVLL